MRTPTRRRNGTPREVSCAMNPPSTEPPSMAAPATICPRPRTDLEIVAVVGEFQCIDQPCLDRAREESEPEPDQHRDDRPRPERGMEVPHQVVEERRAGECQRAEQVGNPPPPGVRNDAGRNFEDHHAGREERVGGKGLEVAQARVEKEQRVDPPDERGGERVAEHQRQVCALDAAGQVVHRPSCGDAASVPLAYHDPQAETVISVRVVMVNRTSPARFRSPGRMISPFGTWHRRQSRVAHGRQSRASGRKFLRGPAT